MARRIQTQAQQALEERRSAISPHIDVDADLLRAGLERMEPNGRLVDWGVAAARAAGEPAPASPFVETVHKRFLRAAGEILRSEPGSLPTVDAERDIIVLDEVRPTGLYDGVTALPTRVMFEEFLDQALARAR